MSSSENPISAVSADVGSSDRLQSLKDAISEYKAPVSCGGSVPIGTDRARGLGAGDGPVSAPPVVIRWSSSSASSSDVHAIELPPAATTGDESHQPAYISKLLHDCAPASFGLDGKNVLDESYRKAAKMDNTLFCTNFHPHDYGIVDAIAQALVPSIESSASEENTNSSHLGVVAELYKLNIYSGPSGKFKAHVDTPRGATQFGSLVVCLPYPYEGGQLVIRHQGHETIHDWSNTKASEISWAAFYSDCEHEVLEVKKGHRITLTYNLYVSKRVGGLIERFPTVNPATYPLYSIAKALLLDPGFMEKGGVLGFWCEHRYAHTNYDASERLPFTLKGVDVAIYSIFRSFGLNVQTRPIMDGITYGMKEGEQYMGKAYYQLHLSTDCEDNETSPCYRGWPSKALKGVVWMNAPNHKELAWVNPSYGNEPSLDWYYSRAAIVVNFPDFETRNQKETAGQQVQGDA